TTGYQSITIQAISTINGGTPVASVSNDGATWTTVYGYGSSTQIPTSAVSITGFYSFPTPGKYFRLTTSFAITGGGFWTLKNHPPQLGVIALGQNPTNIVAINGNTPTTLQGITSTGGTTNLATGLVVSGVSPPGSTSVPYPFTVAGSEAPAKGSLGGTVRTLLVDSTGRLILSGLPSAGNNQGIAAVPVIDLSQTEGEIKKDFLTNF